MDNSRSLKEFCVKDIVSKAAQLILGKDITFTYNQGTGYSRSVPVDLSLVCAVVEGESFFYPEGSVSKLKDILHGLERKPYLFLSTHDSEVMMQPSLLYPINNCWMLYASEDRYYFVTNERGKLTDVARRNLVELVDTPNNSCFFLQEASPSRVHAAANFIGNVEKHGENEAIEKLSCPLQQQNFISTYVQERGTQDNSESMTFREALQSEIPTVQQEMPTIQQAIEAGKAAQVKKGANFFGSGAGTGTGGGDYHNHYFYLHPHTLNRERMILMIQLMRSNWRLSNNSQKHCEVCCLMEVSYIQSVRIHSFPNCAMR